MQQFTPSILIRKALNDLDPLHPQERQPHGGLYSTARAFRDLPYRGGFWSGAYNLISPFMPGVQALRTGASLYATGKEALYAAPRFLRFLERTGAGTPEFTAPVVDTRASMSMRQAALRAVHDSGYMLRNVLGNEARLMHR